jgi:hypothetical protein
MLFAALRSSDLTFASNPDSDWLLSIRRERVKAASFALPFTQSATFASDRNNSFERTSTLSRLQLLSAAKK